MDVDVDVDVSANVEVSGTAYPMAKQVLGYAVLWVEEEVHLWTVVLSQESLPDSCFPKRHNRCLHIYDVHNGLQGFMYSNSSEENANQCESVTMCTGAYGSWIWCEYTICTVLCSGELARLIQTPSIADSLCHTLWPINVFSAAPCLISRLVTECRSFALVVLRKHSCEPESEISWRQVEAGSCQT